MKAFSGYKAERQAAREALPVGAYVAKILDAKEINYDWGSVLLISYDIVEGEHKDFFAKDYKAQTQEDKKWRGTYRLNVPKDNGEERDEWTKNTFGGAMWAIEQSNPGYHWDWNESGLKGKLVGLNYREFDWEFNERTGTSTECGRFETINDVRSGKCVELKRRGLKKKDKPQSVGSFSEIEDDGELPF